MGRFKYVVVVLCIVLLWYVEIFIYHYLLARMADVPWFINAMTGASFMTTMFLSSVTQLLIATLCVIKFLTDERLLKPGPNHQRDDIDGHRREKRAGCIDKKY